MSTREPDEHLTEAMAESRAERRMDTLDRRLLSGAITQEQYEQQTRNLDAWVRSVVGERRTAR